MKNKLMTLRKQFMVTQDKESNICIAMIYDFAQKRAKKEVRELTDTDIIAGAFEMKKVLEDEKQYSNDLAKIERNMQVVGQFLVEPFTEEEVKELIKKTFEEKFNTKDKKTMGLLIKEMKALTEFKYEPKEISSLVKNFMEE